MSPITDPILVFAILALGMLTAPLFSDRFRVPDLVLLLGFGALLGPHGFNVLEHNSAVTLLGAVGLLYIMFLAGIEIDLYRFARSYQRCVGFGLLTFIIPQGLGALAGRYVLGMNWPASILLASMFASHTLLTYPLASRLGITRKEPVVIAVGATIITNTLALLVLAVIADSARGIPLGFAFWISIVLGMLALTVLIWVGIPYASRWFFQRVTEQSNAQFLFVIAALCACAYLSHFAHMEPIIGAFLAGAAFNRLIPEHSPLMNRVLFAGNTLFIPFFLISVGMQVDAQAILNDPHSWLVGATMVVMVVLTKYLAAHLARWLYGYDRASGQVMFGLTVVQAAATLAAVVVGYNLKIFDEAVYNGAIAMILVTCPLGAWVVERYGRRMIVEEPAQMTASTAEQRLLVSVANPESALRLLDLAFLLRHPAMPGGIYPLTIVRDRGNTDEAVATGEKLLGRCLAHAASADIPVTPGLRVAVNVSDGIVYAARELRSSTVIFGWTGEQSASIRIFGSVMHHLVMHCPSRLLFSRLVRPLNTTIRLLAPFPPLASRRRDMPEAIRDLKTLALRTGSDLRVYLVGDEAETLLSWIKNTGPVCRTTVAQASDWKTVRQTLLSEIQPNDTILLPSDRRGGVLWTPALDHLPELIAERFPESNLLVDYPSMPAPEPDTIEHPAKMEDGFPFLLPIDLGPGVPLERALQQMAEAAFPAFPDLARAAFEHLLSSANAYPVELAPGMVLLHARFGNPEQPMLMVCHAPGGWPVPNLPTPPRIVLVLLGSQSQRPEQHLKTLSLVARRMHEAGRRAELQAAKSAEEICALLGRKDCLAPEAESAPRENR